MGPAPMRPWPIGWQSWSHVSINPDMTMDGPAWLSLVAREAE